MPALPGLLAACLLACLFLGPQPTAAKSQDTVADAYPFVSLIASTELPLCTGTLVAPRAVLTAATCVDGEEPALVFVGAFNTQLDPFRRAGDYEIQKVDKVVLHPDYTRNDPRHNNLALLILRKESAHTPVSLPGVSFAYPLDATNATALGFGSLSSDGFWPQLHSDKLTLLPAEECRGLQTAYGPAPAAGMVDQACTSLSHAFRACASGNVGAPLLMEASAGKAVQAGVLTGGFACSNSPSVASASSPALYTWLPQYGDWLADQLTKLRTGGSKAVDGKILQREEAAAQ